jgi:hypothetical protein
MSSAVQVRLGWCVAIVVLGTFLAAALPAWAQAGMKPKPAGVPAAEPAASQSDPAKPQTRPAVAGKPTPGPEDTPPADPQAEEEPKKEPAAEKPQEEPAKDPKPAETPPTQPATPTVDRSTPRATMQSFLVAIEDATGEKPERINDAVKCLDLSRMEEEGAERTEAAQKLAGRLGRLIDQKGVLLQDIPEQPDMDVYTFLAKDVTVGGQERRFVHRTSSPAGHRLLVVHAPHAGRHSRIGTGAGGAHRSGGGARRGARAGRQRTW